ncbi:hypothetical protein AWQ21_14680 (plasmid) [Picosynechococcus sp. PCC 7003]|uniref:hypothetical protein n=1 Tax=Picosynechococcus sp. PCC 7003 TaxID=374981 RepID=UPI000810881C|nr:hypothetical protein [Picosynechococcus sp. PCC 7003]ANV85777.1 hypothetical protein AWQ21_14680 [Picosynechococcus sp. PCC 7003]
MQTSIPQTYSSKLRFYGLPSNAVISSSVQATRKTTLFLLKCAFVCSPKDLHGTAIVTKEVKQRARLNASLITISSLINTIGITPFILIALSGFGIATIPAAAVVLGGINAASNHCGAIAARHAPGYRANAWCGLSGFLMLNTLLTVFTGPGIVLFTNKPAVQQQLATTIIEAQRERLDVLKPAGELDDLKDQINEAQTSLQQIVLEEGEVASRDNPEWQRLYLSLYGTYAERDTDWTTVKTPNLPLTQKLERLETENLAAYNAAKTDLDERLSRRTQYGNDVQFLQAEMPDHFSSNFQPDHNLKSPADGAAIATELFTTDLKAGRFERLAFPMLMAGISIALSATACVLTYTFSRSPAVQDSFDPQKKALVRKAIQILRQRSQ